jgi:ribosomal protein S3AE
MAKPSAALKKAKKVWVAISAPKDFGYRIVGESPVYEQGQMVGRTVEVNLAQLTGDMKKQNMNIVFRVTDVKNNKANTAVSSICLQPSSIRRMVRAGSERIDDSFACITKDSRKVRVKPLLVTRTKIKSSVAKALRELMIKEVQKAVERSTFDEFILVVANFILQKELKEKLSKIYPLKTAQIKWFGFEKERAQRVAKKEELPAGEAAVHETELAKEENAKVEPVAEEKKEEEAEAEKKKEKSKPKKKAEATPEVQAEEPKKEE